MYWEGILGRKGYWEEKGMDIGKEGILGREGKGMDIGKEGKGYWKGREKGKYWYAYYLTIGWAQS